MDNDWVWMVLEMDKGSTGCAGFGGDGAVCGREMLGVEGRLLQQQSEDCYPKEHDGGRGRHWHEEEEGVCAEVHEDDNDDHHHNHMEEEEDRDTEHVNDGDGGGEEEDECDVTTLAARFVSPDRTD